MMKTFRVKLINIHGIDTYLNAKDETIAEFLVDCIKLVKKDEFLDLAKEKFKIQKVLDE